MNKKVLIVEDYDDARSFMKTLVESCGYEVLEASSGEEAISIARRESLNLILMDLEMPDMDGLTTTQIIREFEKSEPVPVIAVTAYGIDDAAAAAAGCNDLIFKPVEIDEIKLVLDKYLIE
jgi:two-component system cell cycle response regulator/two-component system cell cycle response regulator DivK